MLKAERYQGREVTVRGWYRRAPVPYVEIREIECEGRTSRSWIPLYYRLSAIALIAIGLLIAIAPDGIWAWFEANCEFFYVSFSRSL